MCLKKLLWAFDKPPTPRAIVWQSVVIFRPHVTQLFELKSLIVKEFQLILTTFPLYFVPD